MTPTATAAGDFAENSERTAKQRAPKPKGKPRGRPFVPGQSGNPGGRPKDVLGIQRLALERCAEAIEKLTELMRDAESERAQADAASKILDRGCGNSLRPEIVSIRLLLVSDPAGGVATGHGGP